MDHETPANVQQAALHLRHLLLRDYRGRWIGTSVTVNATARCISARLPTC